eukprot:gene281-13009_t
MEGGASASPEKRAHKEEAKSPSIAGRLFSGFLARITPTKAEKRALADRVEDNKVEDHAKRQGVILEARARERRAQYLTGTAKRREELLKAKRAGGEAETGETQDEGWITEPDDAEEEPWKVGDEVW